MVVIGSHYLPFITLYGMKLFGLLAALLVTGWNSSRYLQARLREEIARAQRERSCVSCLIADVDRLQAVNDELGYAAGDRVLQEVGARIESQVRASDAAVWRSPPV